MSAHFQIDVTEIEMFSGYEWVEFGDPCDHDVPHNSQSVIGWGPDVAHYELIEAECGCRAWADGRYEQERQRASGLHGFWHQQIEWHRTETT